MPELRDHGADALGEGDYVFVCDLEGRMLVHPGSPELEGTVQIDHPIGLAPVLWGTDSS